jgi:addiction module RelE/StbE family toxin
MQLLWRPMALADREAIIDYIGQDNPSAAILLDDEFEAKAQLACRQPNLYRLGRVANTREIVVRPHYLMVYQVSTLHNTLTILRVLHTAQQWPGSSSLIPAQ